MLKFFRALRAEINFFFPSRVGFIQNVIPSHETGIKKQNKTLLMDFVYLTPWQVSQSANFRHWQHAFQEWINRGAIIVLMSSCERGKVIVNHSSCEELLLSATEIEHGILILSAWTWGLSYDGMFDALTIALGQVQFKWPFMQSWPDES